MAKKTTVKKAEPPAPAPDEGARVLSKLHSEAWDAIPEDVAEVSSSLADAIGILVKQAARHDEALQELAKQRDEARAAAVGVGDEAQVVAKRALTVVTEACDEVTQNTQELCSLREQTAIIPALYAHLRRVLRVHNCGCYACAPAEKALREAGVFEEEGWTACP